MKKSKRTDEIRYVDLDGKPERVSIASFQHPTNSACGLVHVVRIRDGREGNVKASNLRMHKYQCECGNKKRKGDVQCAPCGRRYSASLMLGVSGPVR